jgi:serine/threonine protein kinase
MADLDSYLVAYERQELSLDQLLFAVERMVDAERGNGSGLLAAVRTQPWRSRLEDDVRLEVEHRVVAAEAAARIRLTGATAGRRRESERAEVAVAEPGFPDVGDVIKQRFELVEELGAGDTGKVFKALDRVRAEARDREPYVAIKILSEAVHQHAVSAVALQREAKKTLRLSHPSAVRVYDFDHDGPLTYMTMEYLSGQSLDTLLREPGFNGLAVEDVLTILRPLAAALTHAHQQRLVHSNFKPSNVFITDDGRVKIGDFGLASAVHRAGGDPDHTVFDPSKLGAPTSPYASIERLDGCAPDPRDDIYALACVTYELLTGRHPFIRASSRRAMAERMEPARPPKLSRRQWAGLKRALAFEREKRTPSVEAFIAPLEPRRPSRRRRWLLALAVAAAAAALAVGAWLYSQPGEDGRGPPPSMPFAPPGPVAPGFEPPDPVPPKAGSENLWPVIKVAAGMLVF